MKKTMTATAAGTAAGIAGLLAENIFHIALDASAYKSAPLKPAPGTEKAEKRTGEGKKCRKKQ